MLWAVPSLESEINNLKHRFQVIGGRSVVALVDINDFQTKSWLRTNRGRNASGVLGASLSSCFTVNPLTQY